MTEHDALNIEQLVERAEWIRALARALVRDQHAAEDLAQDAWLAVLTKHNANAESWRAWIAIAMRNLARARFRGDRRREARERDAARPEQQSSGVDQLDAHELLVHAVRDLDEPYRAVILMRYFEALPPAEIAARTNTPLRTINTRLHRALALLRKRLDERQRGNRGQWISLLAPFTESSSGSLAGVMIMSAKLKLALALVETLPQ